MKRARFVREIVGFRQSDSDIDSIKFSMKFSATKSNFVSIVQLVVQLYVNI